MLDRRRVALVRLSVLLAFVALAARLVDVQILSSTRYAAIGRAELTSTVDKQALRGGIYDRNGGVLAETIPTHLVVADDFQVSDPAATAGALAPVLGSQVSTLARLLSERSGYVVLGRNIDDATSSAIQHLALAGITLQPDSERVYPSGDLASPLLGGVNAANHGDGGIEYEFDSLLSGQSGIEQVQESPDGVPLPGSGTGNPGHMGTGVELTIDQPLQFVTEQALSAEISASHSGWGTAIVMDPRNGQILAMADLVNDPKSGKVVEASSNYAVTQVYEPGSVFKLVTFSAALSAGLISPTTVFTVPDSTMIDGWVFHDAEVHKTEQMTATQIISQSSNVGTIGIARLVGNDRLAQEISDLGVGRPSGLGFPGESQGIVRPVADWSPTSIGSVPIGQDDALTALQVLDLLNTVADGGVLCTPALVRATVNPDGSLDASRTAARRRVLSASVAAELNGMLQQVVLAGTGTAAGVPGYTIAGKTGTAQIPDPSHRGYIPGAYMATFAGYAPAEDPALSAIVVLDHPTPIYGGSVAAPVFSEIMRYALHRYGVPTYPGGGATGGTAQPIPYSDPSGSGNAARAARAAGTIAPAAGNVTEGP